ncbi:MAG TPA: hypothetical protein VFQ53_10325 [Kofleriaceae bacterium]|nr:hypothetical protein [Kofleriaceae bacterium]
MSITKLKTPWQWQPDTNDLAHVSSSARAQTGRVITGMLTGAPNPEPLVAPSFAPRPPGGTKRSGQL